MKNTISVVDLGKKNVPRCRMALCAQENVPKDAVFALSSPKAKRIFSIAMVVKDDLAIVTKADSVEYNLIPYIIVHGIKEVASGFITNSAAFPHKILKDFRKPSRTEEKLYAEFRDQVVKSTNANASKLVGAIYNAIKEAAEQGQEIEPIFFGGKFPEMSAKPKMIYKMECRGDEDVVVGGEMVFSQILPGSRLTVSDKEIALCGAGGWNGAAYCLDNPHEELASEDKIVINAIVAFFARCYAKRM